MALIRKAKQSGLLRIDSSYVAFISIYSNICALPDNLRFLPTLKIGMFFFFNTDGNASRVPEG